MRWELIVIQIEKSGELEDEIILLDLKKLGCCCLMSLKVKKLGCCLMMSLNIRKVVFVDDGWLWQGSISQVGRIRFQLAVSPFGGFARCRPFLAPKKYAIPKFHLVSYLIRTSQSLTSSHSC